MSQIVSALAELASLAFTVTLKLKSMTQKINDHIPQGQGIFSSNMNKNSPVVLEKFENRLTDKQTDIHRGLAY